MHPFTYLSPLHTHTHTLTTTNALLTRALSSYYNREAVVISALQVEKHPVTMPGPFVTPPAQRHLFHSNSAFYMTPPARRPDMGASRVTVTSRTASPLPGGRFGSLMSMQSGPPGATITALGPQHQLGAVPALLHGSPQWRSSPKPHSSPKMKLRCVGYQISWILVGMVKIDSKQSTNGNQAQSDCSGSYMSSDSPACCS